MRIFLSSTSLDLSDARQKILKLLSVIPADLIHMETFGSDETRSVEYSLQQVRTSDLFVGIYAERYGTVDQERGLSITELEYDEARKLLNENRLWGLLVYILDPKASWRVDYVDKEPAQIEALRIFKKKLQLSHTVTFFKDIEELSLSVLRDVLRKTGVGYAAALKARTHFPEPSTRPARPLGMEYYTEGDARWLRGREHAVLSLSDLISTNSEVLLIGDSGIGKTSLVQAGLFPALRKNGWLIASCRPLDAPDETIPGAIWHQLMEGPAPEANIHSILSLVAEAHHERRLLVVVDQLEDIIPYLGTPKVSRLLGALNQIYTAQPDNLHLLLCYRGDTEPKFGQYWQVVSGSAFGLPRYYLGALARDAAVSVVWDVLPAGSKELAEEIVSDTESESMRSLSIQLYPPFLQMVIETLVKAAEQSAAIPTISLYRSLGGARQIIGRYLLNQLRMLGPRSKQCQEVMISLAAHQRRFRKTAEDIARDTNINLDAVEACLVDLANLRLVHAMDDKWEIVHDFLAQKVTEDLVRPEEREARIFRDVVVAKAAAFANTRENLTHKEHLGVYAVRQRIMLTPQEVELLFASSLAGNGPVGYFLRSVPAELPVSWAEQNLHSRDSTVSQNAHRFLLRVGKSYPLSVLADVFSDYKLQAELAAFIRRFATAGDLSLLLKLRLKKAERVRQAAVDQLREMAKVADAPILERLARSRRPADLRLVCRMLIDNSDALSLPQARKELAKRGLMPRLRAMCCLAAHGASEDAERLLNTTESQKLPQKQREASAYALACWAEGRQRCDILQKLMSGDDPVCRGALGAIENRCGLDVGILLAQYARLPFETAGAVLRSVVPQDLAELERFLLHTPLKAEIRDILIAFLKISGARGAQLVIGLVGKRKRQVTFWNTPLLADAVGRAVDSSLKDWLTELAASDEFWRYTGRDRGQQPLPVQTFENLYLFKRLVGAALAAVCDASDWALLKRLIFHDYWIVQAPAAEQVVKFAGIRELNELIQEARNRASDQPNAGVVNALNLMDMKLFPLGSS